MRFLGDCASGIYNPQSTLQQADWNWNKALLGGVTQRSALIVDKCIAACCVIFWLPVFGTWKPEISKAGGAAVSYRRIEFVEQLEITFGNQTVTKYS